RLLSHANELHARMMAAGDGLLCPRSGRRDSGVQTLSYVFRLTLAHSPSGKEAMISAIDLVSEIGGSVGSGGSGSSMAGSVGACVPPDPPVPPEPPEPSVPPIPPDPQPDERFDRSIEDPPPHPESERNAAMKNAIVIFESKRDSTSLLYRIIRVRVIGDRILVSRSGV